MKKNSTIKELVNRAWNGKKMTDQDWNVICLAWVEGNPSVSTEFVSIFVTQFNWDALWNLLAVQDDAIAKMCRLDHELLNCHKRYKYLRRHRINHNNDDFIYRYLCLCGKECLYKYTERDWEDRINYSVEYLSYHISQFIEGEE